MYWMLWLHRRSFDSGQDDPGKTKPPKLIPAKCPKLKAAELVQLFSRAFRKPMMVDQFFNQHPVCFTPKRKSVA